MVPFARCAVVRERGLSSGSVGLASGGYLGTRILSSPRAGVWVACGTSVAPSDPSDTVLEVCLRVRQSGALRVFVALVLVRIILDLWAAPPQCGYWGSMGSFCSAPQDFGLLGFFCARFPPREASFFYLLDGTELTKTPAFSLFRT